ncbi:MAG: ABC transporter ATP-binding protein [Frankiaceae bacterium]
MSLELELRGVRAGYGRIEVVHGVTMSVPTGVVCALLGPNGAGKTTLTRVLGGVQPLWGGSLHWRGDDIGRMPARTRARLGLVLVPETGAIFPGLPVRDNLRVFGGGRDFATVLDTFPVLGERLSQRAGTLSGGEQRMLALARALLADPRVLIVDELSLGLAPAVAADLFAVVGRRAAEAGSTVIVADQDSDAVLRLASLAYVLDRGEVTFAGSSAELAGQVG